MNREGYAEHYNQDADFFSVSRGKVTTKGFFLLESRQRHVLVMPNHPSGYFGSLLAQCELHLLSRLLKLPCLNTFYSEHGSMSRTSVFGR